MEKGIFSKIQEASTHTLIYGFGSVLQSALAFILIPLYTSEFDPDEYGILSLITVSGILLGTIFFLGITGSLSRSYFDYDSLEDRNKVATTSLILILLGAGFQILIAALFSKNISILLFDTFDYEIHILLSLISSAIAFVNNLFFVLLRFARKSKQVVKVNIFSFLISIVFIIFFLKYLGMGILSVILGIFLSQAALFLCLVFLTKDNFSKEFSKHEIRVQIKFGVPTLFTALGHYVLISSDKFFINEFSDQNNLGLYSLGFLLGTVINIILVTPFSQIWSPMRMEYRKDSNSLSLYKTILTYYFILGLLMTVTISIFSKEILILASSKQEYLIAYEIVPIIIFSFLILGCMNLIDYGIYFSRKVIYQTYIFWVSALVNCLLNYNLIPLFGYKVAAYNLLFSCSLAIAICYAISSRILQVKYDFKRLLILIGSSLVVYFIALIINQIVSSLVLILLLKGVVMVCLLIFWYSVVFSLEEKEKLKSLIYK